MTKTIESIIIISSDSMGEGSSDLGTTLMGAFLKKLWASEVKPDAICFYNSGVKLLSKASLVLDALDGLEQAGVDLLTCGTCLDYYAIERPITIGQVSNMETIVHYMMHSKKVITL